MAIVTLLTDFGWTEPFVGAMKGVIKTIAPGTDIVDLTHGVAPFDIAQGSLLWKTATRYFPKGTIHIGVVDPGVGTGRQAIAAQIDGQIYLCPDNGLLSDIARGQPIEEAVVIEDPRYRLADLSRTFHGRDLFAPAAAHLSLGISLGELGPRVGDIVRLSAHEHHVPLQGCVRYFDQFGNAWTDIDGGQMPAYVSHVRVEEIDVPYGEAYGDVASGKPVAVVGSHGWLEIAVNQASARKELKLAIGSDVEVSGD